MSTAYIDGTKYEEITSPKTISGFRTIPFFSNVEQLLRTGEINRIFVKVKWGIDGEQKKNLGI